jgi:hypothetical protein
MKLLDSYQAAPGHCKVCGTASRTPVIDMGWSEDYYGAVYLCIACAEELGALAGFKSDVQIQVMADKILELSADNERLKLELSLNTNVRDVLKPVIKAETDIIRKDIKNRFDKDLSILQETLEKEYESKRTALEFDVANRIAGGIQLALLDLEAKQAEQSANVDSSGSESDPSVATNSGEAESSELSGVQGPDDVSTNLQRVAAKRLGI